MGQIKYICEGVWLVRPQSVTHYFIQLLYWGNIGAERYLHVAERRSQSLGVKFHLCDLQRAVEPS